MNTKTSNSTPLRYILYCRKSTVTEDRQILSLPAQEKELSNFAAREKLHVVGTYLESRSAYKIGRPKFNEMLARIRNGEADAILVWAVNRIARNTADGGQVIYMIDEGFIKEIRTPSSRHLNTPNDKFMLQIELASSKKSSDDNGDSVKRGNREKIERGNYHRRQPGYIFVEDPNTYEKVLRPDPQRFELIQKAMLLVHDGRPVREVFSLLNDEWHYRSIKTRRTGDKPMALSNFYRILNDDFYSGWLTKEDGNKLRGKHLPMLTDAQFEEIQNKLGKRGKPKAKYLQLPYRGTLFCGDCGCSICLEEKLQVICDHCKTKFASRNRDTCPQCHKQILKMENATHLRYVYAKCTHRKTAANCQQRSIKLVDLELNIFNLLNGIHISPKLEQFLLNKLKQDTVQTIQFQDNVRESTFKALGKCQAELDSLLRSYTDPSNTKHDIITPEEYKKRKDELIGERTKFEKQLAESGQSSDANMTKAEDDFSFAATARARFESGGMEVRTDIALRLGSNLTLKNGIVSMDSSNLLHLLKKTNDKIRALSNDTLEPEKSIDEYEKYGTQNEVISTLETVPKRSPFSVRLD